MSSEYAERRIKEALKQAKGNTTRARQQVIAWTFEDAKLLHELTKNHLTGIVAYHIERVQSGRADKSSDEAPRRAGKDPAKKTGREDAFGMELLRAVVDSDAQVFGFEDSSPSRRRGQASQSHVNAIRQMASKSKTSPTKKK